LWAAGNVQARFAAGALPFTLVSPDAAVSQRRAARFEIVFCGLAAGFDPL